MAKTSAFSPKLFTFLRDLRSHNDRDWFQAHKGDFEQHVRDPFLAFIRDIAPQLAKISKHVVADARPVGGSLFRIYRDTRFSSDKTPYKTHAAAHFRHATTHKDVHGPGFYLHLEPGASFIAGGIWRPEPGALLKIREFIAAKPAAWKSAVGRGLQLGGDSVKRPPRGFDAEHPLIADIKRKDFIASIPLKDRDVTSPAFVATVAGACRKLAPLMSVLARATGLPW